MQTGDLVSILARGERHGFRRWGTATVLRRGAKTVRVQFDGSEPFDAHLWDDLSAALDPSSARPILFARPLPAFLQDEERSRA
jgi:hypothetical protein